MLYFNENDSKIYLEVDKSLVKEEDHGEYNFEAIYTDDKSQESTASWFHLNIEFEPKQVIEEETKESYLDGNLKLRFDKIRSDGRVKIVPNQKMMVP